MPVWQKFLENTLRKFEIAELPASQYSDFGDLITKYQLDFDDAFQLSCSLYYNVTIVTMDKDFQRAKSIVQIINPSKYK